MLIRFSWKNFLNFSENSDGSALEVSPLAGRVRQKRDFHVVETASLGVLRFCALYGANASGKSNFVKVLSFFQTVIASGALPLETPNLWCKLSESHRLRPSRFEIEFELEGKVYAYGFEVLLTKRLILSEWLFEIDKKGNDTTIFERMPEKGSFEVTESPETRLGNYLDDFSVNCEKLFLSYVNQSGLKFIAEDPQGNVLKCVYEWLIHSLNIVSQAFCPHSLTYFDDGDISEETLYRALKSFGTGVEGIKLEAVSFDRVFENLEPHLRESIIERIKTQRTQGEKYPSLLFGLLNRKNGNAIYRLKVSEKGKCELSELRFLHHDKEISFSLDEESEGTRRLLTLLPILLSKKDSVFVVDDIDRNLHPNVTLEFVREFFDGAKKNPALKTQLIVTSNELVLLNLEVLRRDEVWFVEKKETGASEIYSLDQFNERFDKKIDKAYLEGRYGAVPSLHPKES